MNTLRDSKTQLGDTGAPAPSILDAIFTHKRAEVAERKAAVPMADVARAARAAPPPLDMVAALRAAPHRPALIAEIKRVSPSRGPLAPDLDPVRLARAYAESGAAAISVLTDAHFFGGSLDDLRAVAGARLGVPLLRKDFVCDPYQVYEARAAGADAVLLIAAHLEFVLLCELHALAHDLGMAALIEVHTGAELASALACGPSLIGVNNRDLHTFQVSLKTTHRLAALIPAEIAVVTESGIFTPAHVRELAEVRRPGGACGVDAILVGEALVTAPDTAALARQLTSAGAPQAAAHQEAAP
jgi:indole-3-glycerol phosphate synthase